VSKRWVDRVRLCQTWFRPLVAQRCKSEITKSRDGSAEVPQQFQGRQKEKVDELSAGQNLREHARLSGRPFQTLALRAISFRGPNRGLPIVNAEVLDLLLKQVDGVSGILDRLLG
jgi:hypothetical protein